MYWQPIRIRIWEIDWYQNEWPWPLLEVVSRSCQLLRYIWRWISRKPLEMEASFQRTTNRKWHVGYQMVTWPMTSRDPKGSTVGYPSDSLASCYLFVINKGTAGTSSRREPRPPIVTLPTRRYPVRMKFYVTRSMTDRAKRHTHQNDFEWPCWWAAELSD